MADTKISGLSSGASGVALTDVFPIERASTANFKLTLQDVLNLIGPAAATFPYTPYTFPQFAATSASIATLTTTTNLILNSPVTANSSVGSATQILASRGAGLSPQWVNPFPVGGIILWSGLISAIPTGWALCDGTNGTPDLRNKFIIGAYSDSVVSSLNRPTTTLTGLVGTVTTAGSYTASGSYSAINGSITNAGSYSPAATVYYNVSLTGGTGSGAKATITINGSGVVSNVVITTVGTLYKAGDVLSCSSIGTGSGFQYTVSSVTYNNVALTGGSGSSATANITVSTGVTAVTIVNSGSGYAVGDTLGVAAGALGTGSGFVYTVSAIGTYTGGTKDAIVVSHTHNITDPGHLHQYDKFVFSIDAGLPVQAVNNDAYYATTNTSVGYSNVTINTAGSDGTNQNLPPYYALAFIMRLAY